MLYVYRIEKKHVYQPAKIVFKFSLKKNTVIELKGCLCLHTVQRSDLIDNSFTSSYIICYLYLKLYFKKYILLYVKRNMIFVLEHSN